MLEQICLELYATLDCPFSLRTNPRLGCFFGRLFGSQPCLGCSSAGNHLLFKPCLPGNFCNPLIPEIFSLALGKIALVLELFFAFLARFISSIPSFLLGFFQLFSKLANLIGFPEAGVSRA